jgi:hypothetical protein
MQFLNNILEIKTDDEIYKDLKLCKKFSGKIIHTKLEINNIENIINDFLDGNNEILKYYFFIDENKWCVSFNVGLNQYDAMIKTTFYIKIYKNIDNNAILYISNEINEHEQWADIYNKLLMILL